MTSTNPGFPKFRDGDVLIQLTSSRHYQLHSSVLRSSSSTFQQLLLEKDAVVFTKKQVRDRKVVRYLVKFTISGPDDLGVFVLDNHGSSGPWDGFDIDNGKMTKAIHKHYDNLFKAFYNIKPDLDDRDLTAVLEDCMGLLEGAEHIGSATIISESIDVTLLRQGQDLFRAIACNPSHWSNVALRIRSPSIFTEAIIHLVGQWQNQGDKDRSHWMPEVLEVCKIKYGQVDLLKQSIELRILGHYPSVVQRSSSDHPGRMSYSNDIYMWMSIALFRHWFSQSMSEARGRAAKDGGATLYRQIAAGGYTYLDRRALSGFHQYFPMSPKGASCLESHLSAYKEELKPFIQPLLVNRSQLDTTREPLPYLTCCEVLKSDLPWLKAAGSERRAFESAHEHSVFGGDSDQDQNNTDAGPTIYDKIQSNNGRRDREEVMSEEE